MGEVIEIEVVRLRRQDWARVALGLLNMNAPPAINAEGARLSAEIQKQARIDVRKEVVR